METAWKSVTINKTYRIGLKSGGRVSSILIIPNLIIKEIEKVTDVKEFKLKEGEEVLVRAEDGTEKAFVVLTCYQNCILHKGQVDILKEKKQPSWDERRRMVGKLHEHGVHQW